MKPCSNDALRQDRASKGPQRWYRLTGLPGWKRAQLGMPAFGDPHCVLHPRPNLLRRLMDAVRRLLARRKIEPVDPSECPETSTANGESLNNK